MNDKDLQREYEQMSCQRELGREGHVFPFSIVASNAIVVLFAFCLLVVLPPSPCNAEQALRL